MLKILTPDQRPNAVTAEVPTNQKSVQPTVNNAMDVANTTTLGSYADRLDKFITLLMLTYNQVMILMSLCYAYRSSDLTRSC